MKRLLLLIFTLAAFTCSSAGEAGEIRFASGSSQKLKASSIAWDGHFGGRKEEPQNTYLLMSQGGFRAPTSKDFKELVKTWLVAHPKAEATLVYTMEGSSHIPDSKFKVVWIIDGDENLNLDLVRKGGCPAGTMVLNPGDETPISRAQYEDFEKRVWEAQRLAKSEKLGIWSEAKTPK